VISKASVAGASSLLVSCSVALAVTICLLPTKSDAGKFGTLEIVADPPSSSLFYNGALYTNSMGKKPFRLTLSPGAETRIKIAGAGLIPFEDKYRLGSGETLRLEVHLNQGKSPAIKHTIVKAARGKRGNATIDVIANGHGAAVSISGKPQGKSPVLGLRLQAGQAYAVLVTAPGKKPWSRVVLPKTGRNPPLLANLADRALAPVSSRPPTALGKPLIIAASMKGNADKGKALITTRCGSCHKRKPINPQSKTRRQWVRYWTTGRHFYRAPLSGKVSKAELAHIRSYLSSKAADVARDIAAGVR
jgi:mono/diheme cytochrome c family protein